MDPLRSQNMQGIEDADELRKKNTKTIAERRLSDLRHICATSEGRRFFWDLLNTCGVFGVSFTAGSADITAFNEGKRVVGMKYYHRLNNADKTMFQKILLESWSEEMSNQAMTNKLLSGDD